MRARSTAQRMRAEFVAEVAFAALALALAGCGEPSPGPVGTPELRAALFDTILARTERSVTRSRGGSLGAYAIQRLQASPFKTTFGNLRLSDVIEPFVEDKRADFAARNINDRGVPETVDDGTWIMDWLEQDKSSRSPARTNPHMGIPDENADKRWLRPWPFPHDSTLTRR